MNRIASADDAPRAHVIAETAGRDLAIQKGTAGFWIQKQLVESREVAAALAWNSTFGVVARRNVRLCIKAWSQLKRRAIGLVWRIWIGRRQLLEQVQEVRGRSPDDKAVTLRVGIGHVKDRGEGNCLRREVDALRGLAALGNAGE